MLTDIAIVALEASQYVANGQTSCSASVCASGPDSFRQFEKGFGAGFGDRFAATNCEPFVENLAATYVNTLRDYVFRLSGYKK